MAGQASDQATRKCSGMPGLCIATLRQLASAHERLPLTEASHPTGTRAQAGLTSHQGQTREMKTRAQAKAEVSSGEWRTSRAPAAAAMAAVRPAWAAGEAAATWRRQ